MSNGAFPSDLAQWTHLRHHEPEVPLNYRDTAKGVRFDREGLADPNTGEIIKIGKEESEEHGDMATWGHWKGAPRRSDPVLTGDNTFGTWSMAMPSVVLANGVRPLATYDRADFELERKTLVTDEFVIHQHMNEVRKRRGFAPIVRGRVYPLWPEGDEARRRLPTGMPGVTLTATYPDEQVDLFMPSPLGALISDHRSEDPDTYSSVVYDMRGDQLSRLYRARLSTAMRVCLPGPTMSADNESPGLALLATRSPSGPGYATFWYSGAFPGSATPPRGPGTGPGADEEEELEPVYDRPAEAPLRGVGVYSTHSWERGGPMHPGAGQADKHFHGYDDEGTPWTGGHDDVRTNFYMDPVRDAPLDFEAPFHPLSAESVFPYQVHLRYDPNVQHTWMGRVLPGKWRWHVKIPIFSPVPPPPKDGDPAFKGPVDPVEKPPQDGDPVGKPKTGDPNGPKGRKPGTPQTGKPDPEGGGGRYTGDPPDGGPQLEYILWQPEEFDDDLQEALDKIGEALEGNQYPPNEGHNAPVRSMGEALAGEGAAAAFPDHSDAYDTAHTRPSDVRARDGEHRQPAGTPYEWAAPSYYGIAVPTQSGTPAWDRFGGEAGINAMYGAPVTAHLAAFAKETASNGWAYTNRPAWRGGTGPMVSGTAIGGLGFLPPEVQLDDADPWNSTGNSRQAMVFHRETELAFGAWSPTAGQPVGDGTVNAVRFGRLDAAASGDDYWEFSAVNSAGAAQATGVFDIYGAVHFVPIANADMVDPREGDLHYDATGNAPIFYNGSSWLALLSSATGGDVTANGTDGGNFAAANKVIVSNGNDKALVDSNFELTDDGTMVLMNPEDKSTGYDMTIAAGAASGTNNDGGDLAINAGAKDGTGTDGALTLGAANTSAVTIGASGITTTVAGGLTTDGRRVVGVSKNPGTSQLANTVHYVQQTTAFGNISLTLPAAADVVEGQSIKIKHPASGNTLNVLRDDSGDTIDGASADTTVAGGACTEFVALTVSGGNVDWVTFGTNA